MESVAHPPIVPHAEWTKARKALLLRELTRQRDQVNAERHRLPMVLLDKRYEFTGPDGKRSLLDLFEGHTYSTFARGCEGLTNSYSLLDVTPYGRQEDFEDSPHGWPQKPTYG